MTAHINYHPRFSPYAGSRVLAAAAMGLVLIVLILGIGTSMIYG